MPRPVDPQKRIAIMQAARKIFARDGYMASKMVDIATEAAVAPGTLYLYFSSKEAISTALAQEFYLRVTKVINENVPHFAEPGGIEKYIDAIVQIALEERDALMQVRMEGFKGRDEESRATHIRLIETMAQSLQQLMDAGAIRKYNPHALANIIFGILHAVIMPCVVFEVLDLEANRAAAAEFIRNALFENRPLSSISH